MLKFASHCKKYTSMGNHNGMCSLESLNFLNFELDDEGAMMRSGFSVDGESIDSTFFGPM